MKVFRVTRIAIRYIKGNSSTLSVRAGGIVSTGGWTDPELKPRNGGEMSTDGLLEFDFVARAPNFAPDVITPISAEATICNCADGVRGVRVYSKENYIMLGGRPLQASQCELAEES